MTDAYRCDGCKARGRPVVEQWHEGDPFVSVATDLDQIRQLNFTLDDLPKSVYSLTDTLQSDAGDYCPDCGREIVDELVALFDTDGQGQGQEGDGR